MNGLFIIPFNYSKIFFVFYRNEVEKTEASLGGNKPINNISVSIMDFSMHFHTV